MTESTTPTIHPAHGPHPGLVGAVSLTLLLAGLVLSGLLSDGATMTSPLGDAQTLVPRLHAHAAGVRVAGFFQVAAAVPLGVYAATVYARQVRLGVRVPGPVIGLVGGIVAVACSMVSGFATYVTGRPEVSLDVGVTHALGVLSFLAGGVGYALGLGLLVAGVAVPALMLGLAPRWFALIGLALALIAELSCLSMLVAPLDYLLPVARFGGLVWLVAAGFLLPTPHEGRAR